MNNFLSKRKQDQPPEKAIRTIQVKVMLNDEEIQILDLARGNLSRAATFRFLLLKMMPAQIPELNMHALIELSQAASDLRQLALHLDTPERIDVDQLKVLLEQFRSVLIGAAK